MPKLPSLLKKSQALLVYVGSLGIAGVRKENVGVWRATPAKHPHIFSFFPAIPNKIVYVISTASLVLTYNVLANCLNSIFIVVFGNRDFHQGLGDD